MQQTIAAENISMVKMPAEGATKCVKATINLGTYTHTDVASKKTSLKSTKLTVYLKKEPDEKDYTGYTKGKAGVGYRAHLVRNGNAPWSFILQPQDDMIAKEYKLLMRCKDERGLPVLDAKTNETVRKASIVFESAHECAEYEDYLNRTYNHELGNADAIPSYTIISWQEDSIDERHYEEPEVNYLEPINLDDM